MNKTVVVNFVAKHSYTYQIEMVTGLIHNDCNIFAIVSKNMPEVNKWRELKNVELYEVDGYTSIISFPVKLLKFLILDTFKIRQRVHKIHPEVVYIPTVSYWSWFVNCAIGKIPLVYTMHDPIVHDNRNIVIKSINYFLGVKAQTIVILSETFRDYVKKQYKKLDREIITIPSGNESIIAKNERIEIVPYDDNKINFLFQGQIAKYKGLHILAEAYDRLRQKYDNVTLTIAGSGDFSEYEDIYSKLVDCTVINRWLTDGEIAGLYNDRNVIAVLPYISATQSGVINVAMPNGSPIIATKCGGIVEQIIDNETGYLAEPGDIDSLYEKMEYVVNHKVELNRIRENAYQRMKEFDWNTLAGRLVEVF